MKQIIIQKKYLILVEYTENMYQLFLIIINFVFDIIEDCQKNIFNFANKTINFFRALFGFNIYKLKNKSLLQSNLYNLILYREVLFKRDLSNKRFLKYSNLLSPPTN